MDQTGSSPPYHDPVLVREVVQLLRPVGAGVIVDATFGGGGHTRALLEEMPGITVLGLDRDPDAAGAAAGLADRVHFLIADFRTLADLATEAGIGELSGALFDLGVSSHQLDVGERGFSYHIPGPLDMRMGPDAPFSAAEVVNEWPEDRLADTIRRYGEERFARRIASVIVRARPVGDTKALADLVSDAIPAPGRRRGHPARRTFQAIRITVNDELAALREGLAGSLRLLRSGGRIVVISYHSLEDRIVKRRFARGARGCVCPPDLPVCGCGRPSELRLLTRRVIRPAEDEVARNPRARSARLRGAERVAS
ncbi:MAG: 16S rRNA (cytosine(1402)-N(4))-methyltransferase RsmH [Acidimicrobiia bacterium]